MAISSISALKTTGPGAPAVSARKTWVIHSVPPVCSSADPMARLATMSRITWALSALLASRQRRQPVRIISSAPHTALMAMGRMPNAASSTTPAMITSAWGALAVWGISAVASSTSSWFSSFIRAI